MPSRVVRLLPLSLLIGATLAAQAPKAVPVISAAVAVKGLQPSPAAAAPVSEDSIYALRVDSAAYPGQDIVLLMDDASVKVEADGRYTFTLHRVVQLLTRNAVDNWGEMTFWYNKERQRITINHLRVIGPDGTVLQKAPAHQEDVNPPADQGAPEITDRRGIQATLASIAPGTLIDYSYTIEKIKPQITGDFSYAWDINGDPPIRRSRFSFDSPATLKALVRVRNIAGDPTDTVVAGRRIRRWSFADLPSTDRQRYAGYPNAVQAWIWVSAPITWQTVGVWYDSLARGRYALNDAVLAAQKEQLKGAKNLTDSLRATYRWVAQDIRYVSLSLGDGSYQPRTPTDVFGSQFGDCKDKATMFVALARHMGVTAYPVLLSSDGSVDSLSPSVSQFDHMIAAVQYGGKTRYLDLTDPLLPYGQMESSEQGAVGLALPASGAKLVVFPVAPADTNWHDFLVAGGFGPDGKFTGRLSITAGGTEQRGLRDELSELSQDDENARTEQIRKHVTSVWASAAVDSQRYTDGHDLNAPVSLSVWFNAPRVIGEVAGGKYYFNLPIGRFVDAEDVNKLDGEGPRRYSIDIGSVNSASVYRTTVEVQLPEGWRAELPSDVTVQSPFGYYKARFSQSGRTLRVSREMGGGRGVLPPDSVKALHTWLQSVENDRTEMIVMSRGTGVDLVASGSHATTESGTLPDVVPSLDDVSNDAKVTQEGPSVGSSGFMTVSSTKPAESFHRSFDARRTVFAVGGSKLISLEAYASAFHSSAEARWMLDALGMFDLHRFLDAFLKQAGGQDMKIDSLRVLPLSGVGDRATGWVFEMVTPVTSLDLAIAIAARGRVAETITAVGPHGIQDSAITALIRQMDDRVKKQDVYLHDIADTTTDTAGVGVVDSTLKAATPVALNTIATTLTDSTRATVRSFNFARDNGWPSYTQSMQGKAFTFPFGKAPAMDVTVSVTLHNTPAEAVREVVAEQRAGKNQVLQSALGKIAGFGSLFVDSAWLFDSTTVEAVSTPRIGEWSEARHIRLRGFLHGDEDDVVFARGLISVKVAVSRPSGQSDPASAAALADRILVRMRATDPSGSETPPAASLVNAVTRVVDADHVVDSLSEAKSIDAAFAAADAAGLAHAPVTFTASTWNALCWWGSLGGQAKRAQAACNAAVAPDTTDLSIRDSRGLQRALAGDLNGARDDFAYIVANVVDGPFKDLRSEWLSQLRDGKNPFTPAVLEELRK